MKRITYNDNGDIIKSEQYVGTTHEEKQTPEYILNEKSNYQYVTKGKRMRRITNQCLTLDERIESIVTEAVNKIKQLVKA